GRVVKEKDREIDSEDVEQAVTVDHYRIDLLSLMATQPLFDYGFWIVVVRQRSLRKQLDRHPSGVWCAILQASVIGAREANPSIIYRSSPKQTFGKIRFKILAYLECPSNAPVGFAV